MCFTNYSRLLVAILLSILLSNLSFAQNNHSFKRFTQIEGQSSGGDDFGYGVTYDHEGSVYTVGKFAGEADFDPGPGTYYMSTNGSGVSSSNAFIQKLDSSGNFLWAQQYGGSYAQAKDVYATNDSCILVTGRGAISTASNGQAFIAKLDGDGNIVWDRNFGGNGTASGVKITTDSLGDIYVTGFSTADSLDLNPGVGIEMAYSNGSWDIWVLKLDANGNYLWSRFYSGSGHDEGQGITVNQNSVFVCGFFENSINFNPTGTPDIHNSNGDRDFFIQRLSLNGDHIWTQTYGGSGNDEANDICNNDNNGLVAVGYFDGLVDFDAGIDDSILQSFDLDLFVLNLDSSGYLNWVQSVESGSHREYANAIYQDNFENYYITGGYRGTCIFGAPDGFERAEITSSNYSNTFITKMNVNGDYLWAKSIGSINNQKEEGWDIAIDENSNLYTTGTFWYIADFDPGPDTVYNTSPANYGDTYTLLLEPCETHDTIITVNGCESYTWIDGITYNSSTNDPVWNLTSSTGCDSIMRLNLVLDDLDSTITQISGGILESNATGVNYQWLVFVQGTGFEILPGETNQQLNTSSYGLFGLYGVVISVGSCVDTSHLVYVNITSEPTLELDDFLSLYPNPSTGTITIEFARTPTQIEISDLTGRRIAEIIPDEKKVVISDLQRGQYLVQLKWKDRLEVRRVQIH